MEIITNGIVDKSLLGLRFILGLVSENYIIVPSSLDLQNMSENENKSKGNTYLGTIVKATSIH